MRKFPLAILPFVTLLAACSSDSPSERVNQTPSKSAQVASERAEDGRAEDGRAEDGRAAKELPDSVSTGGNVPDRPTEGADGQPMEQDERYRQQVIGTWEDDFEGHRTMTLSADGTGTMVCELSGMAATLFASRLEFNMEWSVEKGRLKKRTIDGKPERRVNVILKMMGDRVDEPILELTEERLLLLDKDGKTKYDWRRPSENKKGE